MHKFSEKHFSPGDRLALIKIHFNHGKKISERLQPCDNTQQYGRKQKGGADAEPGADFTESCLELFRKRLPVIDHIDPDQLQNCACRIIQQKVQHIQSRQPEASLEKQLLHAGKCIN